MQNEQPTETAQETPKNAPQAVLTQTNSQSGPKLTPKKILAVWTAIAALFTSTASGQVPELISRTPSGEPSLGAVSLLSASADGRYVAYVSNGGDLHVADTNDRTDVYLYDTVLKTTVPVSLFGHDGSLSNGSTAGLKVSNNGRYVLFESTATNMTPDDTNGETDVFLYDHQTQNLRLVSIDGFGTQASTDCRLGSVTDSGRYVTFSSSTSNWGNLSGVTQVYRKDLITGDLIAVSLNDQGEYANDTAVPTSMDAQGNLVAFESSATNLAPGTQTFGRKQAYVRNIHTGTVELVTRQLDGNGSSGGILQAHLSVDGNWMTYSEMVALPGSQGSSLTAAVFRRNLATGVPQLVSLDENGQHLTEHALAMDVDPSGRWILLTTVQSLSPFDNNQHPDLYVVDALQQEAPRLATPTFNGFAHPNSFISKASIAAEGNLVVFNASSAYTTDTVVTNATQLFAYKSVWAESSTYGLGKSGSFGVPSLDFSHLPSAAFLPDVVVHNTSSLESPICILVYGLTTDNTELSWGTRLVSPDRAARFILEPGENHLPLGFTADMVPLGFTLHYQALIQDPGAIGGISHTNAAWLRVGY